MKTLYLDQVGGVSGDMFLGLLIGLGVEPAAMEAALGRLGAGEIRLDTSILERGGLPATRVRVVTGHAHGHEAGHAHGHEGGAAPGGGHDHRSFAEIVRLIRGSGLPEPVVERATQVFRCLGEAEAQVHGVPLEEIHFHEVGALDSIADIVGTCWGLHELGVERVVSSPFLLGRGLVAMAHGTWPVPAPAVLRLVEGRPVRWTDLDGETVTPTGAALVVTLADGIGGERPMTLRASAQGAGSREWPDRPNVLRGFLGESEGDLSDGDAVEVLETVIDDMTPEAAGHLARVLLDSGVLDVFTTPVIMKKGRPGFQVTVIVRLGEGHVAALQLFRETTTLGIRHRTETRWVLPRRLVTVATEWGPVVVKIAELPDGSTRLSPEFEDCARISRETGIPLSRIVDTVRARAGTSPD